MVDCRRGFGDDPTIMELRRATIDDALDVLDWRNDPDAIAMSKTGAVDRDDHLRWFPKAIEDQDRLVLIAMEAKRKLGMVRFDRCGGTWLASINLAPEERGKGYGQAALEGAIRLLIDCIGSCRISAEIRHDNLGSIRIFEKCGFRLIGRDGDWLHWVRS
jgi:RimJ/RimL family protein N-acetyltransferase